MERSHSVVSVSETGSKRNIISASRAVKPLPPLPRGWSRVCHETNLFLRGIGLGNLVTTFQGFFMQNFSEPEKVAIRRSRVTALLRILIHAVPFGVAIFEIVLNAKGRFVGEKFDRQNYFQFAAKAHEVAMQASLATILLSYIRYQISIGKGMPFGAVLGSLQFLQVSYLWSMELWSSILSKDFQLRKKACFVVLILVCTIAAATAGPSSASLLIPRQDLWPITSTYLAVNASALDLWPDRLDDRKMKRDCATVRLNSLEAPTHCPLSDLYVLLQGNTNGTYNIDSSVDSLGTNTVRSSGSNFSRYLISSVCNPSKNQFCATIPQKNLMDGYYSIQLNHFETGGTKGYQTGYQFVQKNYYQPYTVASCVADVVKNLSDQAPLRFARIAETDSEPKKDREIYSIPGLTKGQIVTNVSGDNSDFRVGWVDLPIDVFNTGIPGAVVVNPQSLNGSSYNITTCTLNAGWGSSAVASTSRLPSSLHSHMSNVPSSWPKEKVVLDAYGYLFSTVPNFGNFSNFSYPQRRISVSKEWMEFLNPTVVLANNSTGKYISLALVELLSLHSQPKEAFRPTEPNVARLLNYVLAVALSDTGEDHAWKVFLDLKNAARSCDTCIVFETQYSVYGWLYSTDGTTTRLAMTVMIAYCLLVLGHIIYSAISGVSSTAWDSAAELVALAMNSSPTKVLENTCAGIMGRQALNTPVRVLETAPGHLELVFGQFKGPNGQTSELVMNKKYGKLAGEDGNEDEEPLLRTSE